MFERGEERKDEAIERLVGLMHERLEPEESGLAERFVRLYYRGAAVEDVAGVDPLDLYGVALAHLRFGSTRAADTAKLRVYNPKQDQHGWQSVHTVVEIVNDDMPFLVDSVTMALSERGLGVHLLLHPVIAVVRDEGGRLTDVRPLETNGDAGGSHESFMHVEVDRQSDAGALEAIEAALAKTLADVRAGVRDWRAMRERVAVALGEIEGAANTVPADELDEARAFLQWLADDNFTFLGFSSYALEGEGEGLQLRRLKGSGLGILRGHDEGAPSRSFQAMPLEAKLRAAEPLPVLAVAKANAKSTVHRPTYLDYIGIKRYDAAGAVVGEYRFLGLFTSSAYSLSTRTVPFLRQKVARVIEQSGFPKSGHSGKALAHLLETFPRDELFQTDADTLLRTSLQVLHLQERQQTKIFVRRDPYDRFVSCLVYVPRERYNTTVRERFQRLLEAAFDGSESDFQAHLTESSLARILFTVRTPDGIPSDVDVEALERHLREVATSWTDRLREALIDAEGEEDGNRLFNRFGQAFPAGYQERHPARTAVPDIVTMDGLEGGRLGMSLHRRLEDKDEIVRFKLLRAGEPVLLSDALPVLENMGLKVLAEEPHRIGAKDEVFWLHDFAMAAEGGSVIEVDRLKDKFQGTFWRIWAGTAENDGFNRLVVAAGLDAGEVVILRALAKYALQVGTTFSQAYTERTLVTNPSIAADLVELFELRFDPRLDGDRAARVEAMEKRIEAGLDGVTILDEDRILRLYLGLIQAGLRTNDYQIDPKTKERKDYLSIKFDPALVPGMPLPRPAFEIFVYAPYVEGVHLRGGKVARGGLRWSDRREDFRTEVLGLVKAQMVKNSVIVPVGAKGGFYVKRPPAGGDRAAFQQEGIRCYKTFLSGLLDITDNRVEGKVVPPADVVRYDEDDPYLVVAADKGTATFSDIANGVSRDYGFWLDDAFASGGSAGYDHKAMGITAKGAWESVKRHFREMGMDSQEDPFTCIGIGDMSGDVFGNGMLLSDKIKLVAAFNHLHVFLDPNPDPAVSFKERTRLFALPRSTWDDYDKSLISEGGGVYARTLKSIKLTPEVKEALGIEEDGLAPAELINRILKAPVDLWWNGGIGTYVKAGFESHADAADRSSDALRVDGKEIRAKVVGEGGNLGFTQFGRIEYAMSGGRINTDFIDNSAGVDCSDHEVNIKILLGEVVAAGDLTMKQRDEVLAGMTDEVARLVLRDNVLQNVALSMSRAMGVRITDAQVNFMRKLEGQGRLDRTIEVLPSDEAIAARRAEGRGLTRPETAVLLAYAKMTLYADLLATDLPDRDFFLSDLTAYFPTALRERFAGAIAKHRLRREIVATIVANDMINRGLEVFVTELEDDTGVELADIAFASIIARDGFALTPLFEAIEGLGRDVPPERQIDMLNETRKALFKGTRWFIAHTTRPISIRESVGRFGPGIERLMGDFDAVVAPIHAEHVAGRRQELVADKVPDDLATRVARLPYLLAACDLVAVDEEADGGSVIAAAKVYFALDATLGLGWLRDRLASAPIRSRWDRLVASNLEDEMAGVLQRLTRAALKAGVGEAPEPGPAVERWLEGAVRGLARHKALLAEINQTDQPDLAMLSVAVGVAGRLLPKVT